MSHVKDYVRHAHDVRHFLTYADNYAIGYFKKQGFTTEISLDKSVWMGYIKDYEGIKLSPKRHSKLIGGTIMQCSMIPKVTYLDSYEIIMAQRKAVFDRIYKLTNTNKVYPGIKDFPKDPNDIPGTLALSLTHIFPGLIEGGYTKNATSTIVKPKSPLYTLLKKMVAEATHHNQAWPFLNPVSGVPDYYDVIKNPMGMSGQKAFLTPARSENP